MLYITPEGLVDAERIKVKIFPFIERSAMKVVHGIVVHQTGGSKAESTFSSYRKPGAFGAHFLIDTDGTIYQTSSVYKTTVHSGMLQSRCYNIQKCSPAEFRVVHELTNKWQPQAISDREYKKAWPDRYPANADAIGIEIVGKSNKVPGERYEIYDPVNEAQNTSLKWLVGQMAETLGVSMTEVFKHPDIARKMPTEASTAKW